MRMADSSSIVHRLSQGDRKDCSIALNLVKAYLLYRDIHNARPS